MGLAFGRLLDLVLLKKVVVTHKVSVVATPAVEI